LAVLPDGARVIYAEDANGCIGKKPELEPHLFEVSVETLTHIRQMGELRGNRK
jgi:hypothetical protein